MSMLTLSNFAVYQQTNDDKMHLGAEGGLCTHRQLISVTWS